MFAEFEKNSTFWCQDDNNYAAQLVELDDVYQWKTDLRIFTTEHTTFDELIALKMLPLNWHGPKETINQINKQFICMLKDIVSHKLCIDEAWIRMLLIIDFINKNLTNIPIMLPCYYVSFLKFMLNFVIFCCIVPYYDGDKRSRIKYYNNINPNLCVDGNNYALFQYLFSDFIPKLNRSHIAFKYIKTIWMAIIKSLQSKYPLVICELIADFAEYPFSEFFDIVHYVNHKTNARNTQYSCTFDKYFCDEKRLYFSRNALYRHTLNAFREKEYERGYKSLETYLRKKELAEAERIRKALEQKKLKRKLDINCNEQDVMELTDADFYGDNIYKRRRLDELDFDSSFCGLHNEPTRNIPIRFSPIRHEPIQWQDTDNNYGDDLPPMLAIDR